MSFEISLHLGVHRSASSFMQSFLQDACFDVAKSDRFFWGPDLLRQVFGHADADFATELKEKFIGTKRFDTVKAMIEDDIDELAKAGRKGLILSDENFLGTMAANLRTQTLYPEVVSKLTALDAILPDAPREIFIGIRDYASYWASSYAFVRVRNELAGFDDLRDGLFDQERRWPDVIADISTVFPKANIHVWSYQDQSAHLTAPLSQILRREVGKSDLDTRGAENVGLSATQFSSALAMRDESPLTPSKDIIEAAKQAKGRGKQRKFQRFPWPQVRKFRRRFARDIKELQGGVVANVNWIGAGT